MSAGVLAEAGLARERRESLVAALLVQAELFDGVDRKHQAEAMAAAGLLVRYEVRQVAEALVVLVDRMELDPEQRREVVEEARQILAGEARVGITPAGAAERSGVLSRSEIEMGVRGIIAEWFGGAAAERLRDGSGLVADLGAGGTDLEVIVVLVQKSFGVQLAGFTPSVTFGELVGLVEGGLREARDGSR